MWVESLLSITFQTREVGGRGGGGGGDSTSVKRLFSIHPRRAGEEGEIQRRWSACSQDPLPCAGPARWAPPARCPEAASSAAAPAAHPGPPAPA